MSKKVSLITPEIREMMAEPDFDERMRDIFGDVRPYEVSSLLEGLRAEEIARILLAIGLPQNIQIFEEFDDEDKRDILLCIKAKEQAQWIEEMSPDERIDLLKILPEEVQDGIYRLIARAERNDIKKLITYEEGSVGALVTTEYASVPPNITVSRAMEHLRRVAPEKETIYYIYVLDEQHVCLGVVSLRDLITAKPDTIMENIMIKDVVRLLVDEHQEHAAKMIADYDVLALPAVDSQGRMIGIVTVDDVMDVVIEEGTEDILNLGAAGRHVNYMNGSVFSAAKQRVGWLLILILVGFVSGWVLQHYQDMLNLVVSLVFFIPMLCASGGNAGTQSATVVIRELATEGISVTDLPRVLFKEFKIGMLMGSCLGAMAAVRALLIGADPRLGLVVGFAMMLIVMMATSLGALFPILLKKMRLDPALMSGPLIASLVDVGCIVTYMELSRLIFS